MPAWLFERWKGNFGPKEAAELVWASIQRPPATWRARGGPSQADILLDQLAARGIIVRQGEFSKSAIIIEGGRFQEVRSILRGAAVMQDEASQIVTELVAPRPGERVLDVCAAPGMKSEAMAYAMGSGALVACDASARRLRAMKKLLAEWSGVRAAIHRVQCDARTTLPFRTQFDRILVDAPCSGTGTLARNPEIKWRLRAQDLKRYAADQRAILAQALAKLALGGRLVYATCSLEPEENDAVVGSVLRENPEFRALGAAELAREYPRFALLFDGRGCLRTRPDLHGMDGFFAAVMVHAESGL